MAEDATRPLLEVTNLKVHFPILSSILRRQVGAIQAVDGVSFSIDAGTTLGLVGESGSGKSTTGRAVVQLREPTGGEIKYDGRLVAGLSGNDLHLFRRNAQMIFQDPFSSLNPRMTAGAIAEEPLIIHRTVAAGERRKRVRELFELVGLNPWHMSRFPHQFSGGQRQRIGIARALAVEPRLLVCDEPVSALDVSIQAQILNLLAELRERLGLTYLFIAHDLAVVRHLSERVAVMYLGRIVEIGPTDQVFRQAKHPYTAALLSAVTPPRQESNRRATRIILQGDLPSPASPPPGCRFHTRCWLYERLGRPEVCRAVDPVLASVGTEQAAACHFPGATEPQRGGVADGKAEGRAKGPQSVNEATSGPPSTEWSE